MFLYVKTAFHIVDTAPRFSVATFLDDHGYDSGQLAGSFWLAVVATGASYIHKPST